MDGATSKETQSLAEIFSTLEAQARDEVLTVSQLYCARAKNAYGWQ